MQRIFGRQRLAAMRRALSSSATMPQVFCPRTHSRLEPQGDGVLAVGLTERLCDDVGDVTLIAPLVAPGDVVVAGQELVRIEWTALHISDGDELYHTTWANAEGATTLLAPCDGTVGKVNSRMVQSGDVDAADWLVTLETSGALPEYCVDEAEYLQRCGTGKFGQSEESLSYTSYG